MLVPDAVSLFLVARAPRARYGARFRTRLQHGAILLLTQHMRQAMVVLFLRDVRSRFWAIACGFKQIVGIDACRGTQKTNRGRRAAHKRSMLQF